MAAAVQQHVSFPGRVQVQQEDLDHRHQVPMGEHGALGHAGRARRIEEPREVVGLDPHLGRCRRAARLRRLALEVAPLALTDADEALDRLQFVTHALHVIAQQLVVDEDARARVVEHVRVLARV